MNATKLIAHSYNLARTPWTVLDTAVLRRLDRQSSVRRVFDRAFGTLDLAAGRLLDDQTLVRQGAERLGAHDDPAHRPPRAEQPPPAAAEPKPAPKPEPKPRANTAARKARASAAKSKEHDAARPNQSLKTMQLRLARTEAIVEARNNQDEDAPTD